MTFLKHIQTRSFGILGFDQDEGVAWVDYEGEVVTFPLWNLSGQLVGYQKYSWDKPKSNKVNPIDQKYFTRLPKGTLGFYGLDLLPLGYLGPIYLVEGIWEALVGWFFGIPCIAILGVVKKGVDSSKLTWLNTLPNEIIPLCQNDDAGRCLAKVNPKKAIFLEGDLDDLLLDGGWFNMPEEMYNGCS